MSIFDDMSSMVNRGSAAASRKAEQLRLNSQLSDLQKRRQALAAQLGASLYEVVRQYPELCRGREDLLQEIHAVDMRRKECEERLREIQQEQVLAQQAAVTTRCPQCNAPLKATDLFCSVCGAAVNQNARMASRPPVPGPATPQKACPSCGQPVAEGDAFCMVCGTSLKPNNTPRSSAAEVQASSSHAEDKASHRATVEAAIDRELSDRLNQELSENFSSQEILEVKDSIEENLKLREVMEASEGKEQEAIAQEALDDAIDAAVDEALTEAAKKVAADMEGENAKSFYATTIAGLGEVPADDGSEALGHENSNAEAPNPASDPKASDSCPYCGQPVMSTDVFCMHCGSPLDTAMQAEPEQTVALCPSCGTPVEEGYVFCGNCGQKLR